MDLGKSEITVRALGRYTDWRDFAGLVVAHREGKPVRLSDIATVRDGIKEQRSYARYNGKEAVSLNVVRQSGANTVQVADGIVARIADLEKELPPDIKIIVATDNSEFIRDSVEDVIVNILYGGLLAVLVIFLFLADLGHCYFNFKICLDHCRGNKLARTPPCKTQGCPYYSFAEF